jgi:curved DNA-binding protein CbpA
MASLYHPDHNPQDTKEAEEKFKEINQAYEVLSDKASDGMIAMAIRINKQSLLKSIILAGIMFCPDGMGFFLSGRDGRLKKPFVDNTGKQG